jgi:hypothetical protein
MPELRHDGLWHQDSCEKLGQDVNLPNQDQIVQRCGIGDNGHTGTSLVPPLQVAQRLAIVL